MRPPERPSHDGGIGPIVLLMSLLAIAAAVWFR